MTRPLQGRGRWFESARTHSSAATNKRGKRGRFGPWKTNDVSLHLVRIPLSRPLVGFHQVLPEVVLTEHIQPSQPPNSITSLGSTSRSYNNVSPVLDVDGRSTAGRLGHVLAVETATQCVHVRILLGGHSTLARSQSRQNGGQQNRWESPHGWVFDSDTAGMAAYSSWPVGRIRSSLTSTRCGWLVA